MMIKSNDNVSYGADFLRQLRALARYLPALENPDFHAGAFAPVQKTESGALIMPYVVYSDVVEDFVKAAYEHGCVLIGFRWAEWAHATEAQALCHDPSKLARATPERLLRLLTAIIRQDRFCEGVLLHAFETGLMFGIVRRAAAILEGEAGPSRR
jgi:hypothetical protein